MVWTIVLATVGVIGLFIQFFIYVLPRLKENRTKRSKATELITRVTNQLIDDAESYKTARFSRVVTGAMFETGVLELLEDAPFSKKMLTQLGELDQRSDLYNRWLGESSKIVMAEVGRYRLYPTLARAFEVAFGNSVEYALGPKEGYRGDGIHETIFKGNLTFESAKEVVLEGRWQLKIKIKGESGEETQLVFGDVLEGEDFHRFIKELQLVQERESIKMLRDVQLRLLEKARIVLREVS